MQNGSKASWDSDPTHHPECDFCQRDHIAANILKETPFFRVVADHAPLVEGHILIVPRKHYPCYGGAPATLDTELFALKDEVRRFFGQFYDTPIFWEHGVFRQTVFHAHLHCFPFGDIRYDVREGLHGLIVQGQDDIRRWYTTEGHYFYLEDTQNALLFAPEMDTYMRILQTVLWPGASSHSEHKGWRSPQQRIEDGKPLIQSTAQKWRLFQQQEVNYADEAGSR
jgi:diadenosine tetraphosphate (Ap4A) HIT family hydrolase